MLDFLAFPDQSRVWIYQSNKPFPEDEVSRINKEVAEFAKSWVSHNRQLKATGGLLHDRFVVLVADETHAGPSGCSIDASVHFVKSLEHKYSLEMFDRMQFAFINEEGEVEMIHAGKLAEALKSGMISEDTLFFDNLVDNKKDFLSRWLVPFGKSWMKRFI